MDYAILLAELTNDPLGRGYAGMTDAEVAASLNLSNRSQVASRRVDERTVLNEFQPSASAADVFLTKLEAVAVANSLVGRVMQWMHVPEDQGGGLDVGNPRVRSIAPGLVGQAGITQVEVDELLALAESQISRADELGLGIVREGEVQQVRAV